MARRTAPTALCMTTELHHRPDRPTYPKCGRSKIEELVIETERPGESEPVGQTRQWRCWWCMHTWDRDREVDA